ncbi:MAG: glycosyltransferase family 4 protein [Actinobacteria bacterium]|nr:glycosyltransferase family 4 protein [Actinomycetota bacterium]
MRMLIVCDYSLGYLGGAQTALKRQAEALAAAGHSIIVLAPEAATADLPSGIICLEPLPSPMLPVLELPLLRANNALRRFVAAVFELARFDAVILHSEFGLAASVAAEATERGIPVLHTVHTFFWRGPALGAPLAPVVRAFHRAVTRLPNPQLRLAARPLDSALREMTLSIARAADAVLSPSAHQAEPLRAAGLPRVEVVSNVTEADRSPLPLPSLGRRPGDSALRLAWLGRFAPEKRLDVALSGVALASEQGSTLRLDVAGGSPSRRQLDASRALPILWHHRLSPTEVSGLLDRSHALLLTSHGFDNQPMVALEAFSRGRPIITVDPALAREFGGAAILCRNPSAAGVASTLQLLAAEPWRLEFAALDAQLFVSQTSGAVHAARITAILHSLQRGAGRLVA